MSNMPSFFAVGKDILNLIILPLLSVLAYFCRDHFSRVKALEADLADMKTEVAVNKAVVIEIKDDIKDIKSGIDRLVSRVHG